MELYALKVTADDGERFWLLFRHGEISQPVATLTEFEAKRLAAALTPPSVKTGCAARTGETPCPTCGLSKAADVALCVVP